MLLHILSVRRVKAREQRLAPTIRMSLVWRWGGWSPARVAMLSPYAFPSSLILLECISLITSWGQPKAADDLLIRSCSIQYDKVFKL